MTEIIYKCENCNRSFRSKYERAGHMKVHRDNYEEIQRKSTQNILKSSEKISLRCEQEYYKNPKFCLHCEQMLPYGKEKEAKFCSRSCACTYNNLRKDYSNVKETWKQKIANNNLPEHQKKKGKAKTFRHLVDKNAVYTKLYKNVCTHCGNSSLYRKKKKYCNNCSHLYSNKGRGPYWFTFNPYKYPDLFDLNLVTEIGFYHYIKNKNGLTRDHKISVNAAIKNNYDPYYIKHPLNCELMSFAENNKKKAKCSILYEDLVRLVDEYENKKILNKNSA